LGETKQSKNQQIASRHVSRYGNDNTKLNDIEIGLNTSTPVAK
jgi:hypothetical protein